MHLFPSIQFHLNHWEFCPFCHNRLRHAISTNIYSRTLLDNTHLRAFDQEQNQIVNINLPSNQILFIEPALNHLLLTADCKQFHFRIVYNIDFADHKINHLNIHHLFLAIRDKKINYHISSDYHKHTTSINILDQSANSQIQTITTELLPIRNLDKKQLAKQISAFCLLQ